MPHIIFEKRHIREKIDRVRLSVVGHIVVTNIMPQQMELIRIQIYRAICSKASAVILYHIRIDRADVKIKQEKTLPRSQATKDGKSTLFQPKEKPCGFIPFQHPVIKQDRHPYTQGNDKDKAQKEERHLTAIDNTIHLVDNSLGKTLKCRVKQINHIRCGRDRH